MGIGSRGEALKHRVLLRLGMSPRFDDGPCRLPGDDIYETNFEEVADTRAQRLQKMLRPRLQRLLADASPYLERLQRLASAANARLRRNPKVRRTLPLVVGTALILCICGARRCARLPRHGARPLNARRHRLRRYRCGRLQHEARFACGACPHSAHRVDRKPRPRRRPRRRHAQHLESREKSPAVRAPFALRRPVLASLQAGGARSPGGVGWGCLVGGWRLAAGEGERVGRRGALMAAAALACGRRSSW